jgi:hypothetical protein
MNEERHARTRGRISVSTGFPAQRSAPTTRRVTTNSHSHIPEAAGDPDAASERSAKLDRPGPPRATPQRWVIAASKPHPAGRRGAVHQQEAVHREQMDRPPSRTQRQHDRRFLRQRSDHIITVPEKLRSRDPPKYRERLNAPGRLTARRRSISWWAPWIPLTSEHRPLPAHRVLRLDGRGRSEGMRVVARED